MRRLLLLLSVAVGCAVVAAPTPSQACPLCKYANEEAEQDGAPEAASADNTRPKAYMYSILFMLSMPPTIFAGISLVLYRAWKRGQPLQASLGGNPLLNTRE